MNVGDYLLGVLYGVAATLWIVRQLGREARRKETK